MKRRIELKPSGAACLLAMPMMLGACDAWAVDPYLAVFNGLYGTAATKLNDCLVCHVTSSGGAINSYGSDFGTAKLSDDTVGVQNALIAIEPIDSDQDSIINIDEINAATWPGDCTDPDPANCPGGGVPPDVPPGIPPGTITEGPTMIACYAWEDFPNERLAVSIKRYGGLVTEQPRNDFIESQFQTNHGVLGKHVGLCGQGSIGQVDGTLLKQTDVGTHLSFISYASRGDGSLGGDDWCRSVVVDCTSEDDAQVPTEFECRSRNEFDVLHGESELKLVENPEADPLCNVFEDTSAGDGRGKGRASGLNIARGGHDRDDDDDDRDDDDDHDDHDEREDEDRKGGDDD